MWDFPFFFILFWFGSSHCDAEMQRQKEAFARGRRWFELWAAYFWGYIEKKRSLNRSYPNDLFRASPTGPSLSGLIIWRQIGDALVLMMLTPFASWTINEELHSSPLDLAWPGGQPSFSMVLIYTYSNMQERVRLNECKQILILPLYYFESHINLGKADLMKAAVRVCPCWGKPSIAWKYLPWCW